MSPRERARVLDEIESLERAMNHERNVRNHTRDVQVMIDCETQVAAWLEVIKGLRRKLHPKLRRTQ
ncbi:MAG: hypothetical protein WA485_09000 [Candidatus Sulfotelmatobacter sp.]